jgi:hypothetical protein
MILEMEKYKMILEMEKYQMILEMEKYQMILKMDKYQMILEMDKYQMIQITTNKYNEKSIVMIVKTNSKKKSGCYNTLTLP